MPNLYQWIERLPPHTHFGAGHLRSFVLYEVVYEIDAVIDQWYEESASYSKVPTAEGKTYLLGYDEEEQECTLQSGSDGGELLAKPSIELVTVDSAIVKNI